MSSADEAEALGDLLRAWGQIELSVEGDLTVHERLMIFISEVKEVLDFAVVDGDAETDVAALDVGRADDLTSGENVGVVEPGIDRLQPGIAAGTWVARFYAFPNTMPRRSWPNRVIPAAMHRTTAVVVAMANP